MEDVDELKINNTPFFSIVMPVYNVEKFLDEAISSILNQTFSNFQLILVDDGSTDSSNLIANQYLETDSRIILIRQKNSGLSAARNKGIEQVTGSYIYFFDSDDVLNKTALQYIYKLLSENAYPDIVAFNAQPFLDDVYKTSESEKVLQVYLDYYARRDHLAEKLYSGVEFYQEMATTTKFVAPVFLYVIKSGFLKDVNLKFVNGILHEDEVFSRYLFINANSIFFTKKKLYHYRIRHGSITQSAVSKHKIISLIKVADKLYLLYKQKDIKELKSNALQRFTSAIDLYEKFFSQDRILFYYFISSKLFIQSMHKKRLLKLQFPLLYKAYRKFRASLPF